MQERVRQILAGEPLPPLPLLVAAAAESTSEDVP